MAKRSALHMTAAQVEAHNRRHGFTSSSVNDDGVRIGTVEKLPKPRMNKTETSFSLILEAQKHRGEVAEWRFQPFALHWGIDAKTGNYMRYRPDFFARLPELTGYEAQGSGARTHRVIEVKGGHIFSRDLVRFKGCRAEWQWLFDFELWQKKEGVWRKIL